MVQSNSCLAKEVASSFLFEGIKKVLQRQIADKEMCQHQRMIITKVITRSNRDYSTNKVEQGGKDGACNLLNLQLFSFSMFVGLNKNNS